MFLCQSTTPTSDWCKAHDGEMIQSAKSAIWRSKCVFLTAPVANMPYAVSGGPQCSCESDHWSRRRVGGTAENGIYSTTDRLYTHPHRKPTITQHTTSAMPQYTPDKWINQLKKCQHLPEADMKTLCDSVRAILMEESNIQPVSSPVTICGDVHGQFWDVLELLRKGGDVPQTSYIFMARM